MINALKKKRNGKGIGLKNIKQGVGYSFNKGGQEKPHREDDKLVEARGRYPGRSAPGQGNSKCKGPEAGMCLVGSRNNKEALWLESSTSQQAFALSEMGHHQDIYKQRRT